ncbi:TIGR03435 family protein [Terriglobus sp. 2YAB30_2]|uniref:TIGR03435 family protein n=1 Tax=unclassified Terriglobus TaxID=2628988 RepID=UPI003F943C29
MSLVRNTLPAKSVCVLLFVLFSALNNSRMQAAAQAVSRSPQSLSSENLYEVATVKLSNPYMVGGGFRVRGRRLESVNTSLGELILFAYELQRSQLLGTPSWAETEKFDATMLYRGEGIPGDPQCKAMIRQLLGERFGLRFHREEKELPIFALVLGQNGPKLRRSDGGPDSLPALHFSARGNFQASNARVSDLAQELQRTVLNRPVIDRTGLEGRWDFSLAWTPNETQFGGHSDGPPISTGNPDLFTAIQEQLGLKLQAMKAPAGTLVVDAASRPSGN